MKKTIFILLLIIFFFNLFYRIYGYRDEYTQKFDFSYWEDKYNKSQWVIPTSKNPIGDDGLYTYEAWRQMQGADPTLLNPEVPPLGKYIIGTGELVFGNQNILILIIGLLCLCFLYILNLRLFKDKLMAFIPVFIFSLDPLFYTQLRAPYLDTTYLLFLLLTIIFTLKKKYVFASLFLGCFAVIKVPIGSLFLFAPILFWVVIFDRNNIKKFFVSLILWPSVVILSYLAYFIHGGTFYGFLGVQKLIITFYTTGAKSPPGIFYPMIFFGTWHTWFDGVKKVSEWTLLWPISFIASCFAAIPIIGSLRVLRAGTVPISQFRDKNLMLIIFWVASYLIFLSFTPVFPRYLLLLLPFMYNLSVWFLAKYVFQRSL